MSYLTQYCVWCKTIIIYFGLLLSISSSEAVKPSRRRDETFMKLRTARPHRDVLDPDWSASSVLWILIGQQQLSVSGRRVLPLARGSCAVWEVSQSRTGSVAAVEMDEPSEQMKPLLRTVRPAGSRRGEARARSRFGGSCLVRARCGRRDAGPVRRGSIRPGLLLAGSCPGHVAAGQVLFRFLSSLWRTCSLPPSEPL